MIVPVYSPQGFCPRAWIVQKDGQVLTDKRGAARRFATEKAAKKAGVMALIDGWR